MYQEFNGKRLGIPTFAMYFCPFNQNNDAMKEDFVDYDDNHYASYKDWQPGTPETAYKILAGFRCSLKRSLDFERLYLTCCVLEIMSKQLLPGSGLPYTLFSVSYLHAIQHGVTSDREKYCVAKLEKWEEYIQHFRQLTGLPLRMGTQAEVLVYASQCFDVYMNHHHEWKDIFAKDGDEYVSVDVYSQVSTPIAVEDNTYGDILLVCDKTDE